MNVPAEVLWSIAGFIATTVIYGLGSWIMGLRRKNEEQEQAEQDTLKKAVRELSEVVRELRYEVKSLNEKVAIVPKLADDVRKAYEQIRDLRRLLPKEQ